MTASGSNSDNSIDIGNSGVRFKDLYLSSATYCPDYRSEGVLFLTYDADDSLQIRRDNGAEAARFDSAGNLLVGTTSTTDSAPFSVFSTGTAASFRTSPTTTVNLVTFRNGNGLIGKISTSGSTTTYNTSSDQRLKDLSLIHI